MLAEPAIQAKLHDLDATFLEPSAGEGAFLTEIVDQRIDYVDRLGMQDWKLHALQGLSTIYGIEFLDDNLMICRQNMVQVVEDHYTPNFGLLLDMDFLTQAEAIIKSNVVQGNTLTHKTKNDDWITFKHWQISEDGITSTDFKYDDLFR